MIRYGQSRAFTLFEILIAVCIFAILGLLAGLTLHSVLRTHQRLKAIDAKFMQVQMVEVLLSRDISQIINRPVTQLSGLSQPAVMTYQQSGVVFTTFGLQNPGYWSKSARLVRIGYSLQGNKLVRLVWPRLDLTANHSAPNSKVLLEGVESMRIQYVDQKNRLVDFWPEANLSYSQSSGAKTAVMPKSIMVTLTLKHWGMVQRMINLPGVTRDVSA